MKIVNTVLTIAVFMLMTTLTIAADDASKAGVVLITDGEVNASNSDGQRALERRSSVYVDDVVSTGEGALAQFRMIDGALVALSENSQWSIESYEYAEDDEEDSVSMKLLKGGLRTISGKAGKNKPESYKLDTPVASIGIRGTHYEVDIINDALIVGVLDGEISIFAESCDQGLAAGGLLSITSSGECVEPSESMIEQREKRQSAKLKFILAETQELEESNAIIDSEATPVIIDPLTNADVLSEYRENCDCPDLK